jgi:hypothetical protein
VGVVRDLERAYRLMWEGYLAGGPPRPLTVADGDPH